MNSISVVVLGTILAITSAANAPNDSETQRILANILRDYDPKIRPNYTGRAVEVLVDATVISISNIDEVKMIYTLDMFFRQRWKDHRLKHNLVDNLTLIMGTKQPSDIIWVPDTVFIDSVVSNMHHVTVNNHKIDINYDGSVFWGTRVTVSPSCELDLKSYPMDKQTCPFEIVSYAYTSRHVVYKWKAPGLRILPIYMAQFVLNSYTTSRDEVTYVAGNYTILKGHFHFKRLMGFAIMQTYIPTICVVIVSWISLWVKRSAVPARFALLITTLLTISTVWASVNAQLPRVNYVKAIDIFMMASFGSVIMALLEFTIVLNTDVILTVYLNKCARENEKKEAVDISLICDDTDLSVDDATGMLNDVDKNIRYRSHRNGEATIPREAENVEVPKKQQSERLADAIENVSRTLFPFLYITFLVIYFAFYLPEKEDKEI